MNSTARKVYVYIILFMVILSTVLSYTVSVRENLGSVKVSIILRYYAGSFLILVMLFFASIHGPGKNALPAAAIVLLFVCMMFKGFIVNNNTDHYWLLWYLAVDMKLGVLPPPEFHHSYGLDMNSAALNLPSNPMKVIYTSAIAANIILAVIVLVFQYIYSRKGAKRARNVYAGLLVIMCAVLNCAACAALRFTYPVNAEAVKEVIAINEHFKDDSEADILYLTHGVPKKRFDRAGRYMDTYMERRQKFYIVSDSEFNGGRISENVLREEAFHGIYEDVQKIDYVIIHNMDSREMRKLANVEKIDSLSGKYYTVYKNLNPSELHFE